MMNQTNILKKSNKNKIFFLKKNLYSKKTCKTHDLDHETRTNLQEKKLKKIKNQYLKKSC